MNGRIRALTHSLLLLGVLLVCGCNSLPRLQHRSAEEVLSEFKPQTETRQLPTRLDLTTAKHITLAENPDVAAATARVDQAYARLNQSRAAYLPTLTASAAYTHTEWAATPGTPAGNQGESELYTAGIEATWLLFDGFKREFTELAARYGRDLSEEAKLELNRALSNAVAQTFLGALLQRELMRIAEADATFAKSLLDDEQKRLDVQGGSPLAKLDFQISHNQARAQLIQAKRDHRIARMALAELMGIRSGKLPETVELVFPKTDDLADQDIEATIAAALKRPDLRVLAMRFKTTEASMEAARGALYPSLAAFGEYGYARTENPRFGPDDRNGSIGLALEWNIDVNNAKWQAYKEAKAATREAEALLRKRQNAVYKEVNENLETIRSAKEILTLNKETVELAKELRDKERLRWRQVGAGVSITRLNEVQAGLVRAQASLAIARIQLLIAYENLAASANRNVPLPE